MSVVEIVIIKEPQTTVETQMTTQNTVITAPGPQGEPGLSAGAAGSFTQPFTDANFVSVPHNLGFKPNVVVIVNGENISDGVDISYPSLNTVVASWNSTLLSGEVVCS